MAKAELADLQTQSNDVRGSGGTQKISDVTFDSGRNSPGYAIKPAAVRRENIISTSGKFRFQRVEKFTVAAGETVSLFAQSWG